MRSSKFLSGGRPRSVEDDERDEWERLEQKLREARINAARSNPRWTELEAVDLVKRGHNELVSAATDHRFLRHRGVVFETGTANIFATEAPLHWYIDRDSGDVIFLDRLEGSWSEHFARLEQRRLRIAR